MIIVRIWDYRLLPYLPDAQFKGQLRELIAIMHDWRDKGKTNHLLINRVMKYDKKHLTSYFLAYREEYKKRYCKKINDNYFYDFLEFADYRDGEDYNYSPIANKIVSFKIIRNLFPNWHNKEYLRVCMANLYEKHRFGIGKSRITDDEWKRLLEGYKKITGEEYQI